MEPVTSQQQSATALATGTPQSHDRTEDVPASKAQTADNQIPVQQGAKGMAPQDTQVTSHAKPTPDTPTTEEALARVRKLENIVRYLPLFCEPLRSILASSPHLTQVPVKWY